MQTVIYRYNLSLKDTNVIQTDEQIDDTSFIFDADFKMKKKQS